MRSLKDFKEIYVYNEFVDMRKSINGLSALAQLEADADWSRDPLFVFVNKRREILKILYFDQTGFALWTKRLEEDKFPWKKVFENKVSTLTNTELEDVLRGVNIFSRHSVKSYKTLV